MIEFTGKTAVITGGAHGIGKAIADAFRRANAAVYIIDSTPGDWFTGDVGNKETFLCSDKAGFITGENICVVGGMTRQMI